MTFEQLYKTYYMQVYSYVMTLCRNHNTAEELTQQTFFKAVTARDKARYRNDARLLTWLCAIAKNLFIDECRKQKRFVPLPDELSDNASAETQLEDLALTVQIHDILRDLPEPYKQVFELRVYGECPFALIGKEFGKSENWARVTYHRAKIKIQERMGLK